MLGGDLSDGMHTITVSGIRKLKGGLPSTTVTGYNFNTDGQTIAGVEVIGKGRGWISNDASTNRRVLSASAAALLLLEDLRAHLPD